MQIRKAVITAAGPGQRTLPMQLLIDQQGVECSVLSLVVREASRAGINDVCIVVSPGDEEPYSKLVAKDSVRLTFIPQRDPRGYAHAVFCARDFVGNEPFLHFVGDHIYIGPESGGSAKRLIEAASSAGCSISTVQITRENLLPFFGTVGGQPVPGKSGFYRIETVLEKPTPTDAEQRLIVPGLRAVNISASTECTYSLPPSSKSSPPCLPIRPKRVLASPPHSPPWLSASNTSP
jgi:UTP--glucose-1-phosphate uridylyltransferase